jgi:hypothetical protein
MGTVQQRLLSAFNRIPKVTKIVEGVWPSW